MHQSTLIFANHKYFHHFAQLCLVALFFFTFSFLSPTCLYRTHAEASSSPTIPSSLSLAFDQELTLDITPTASGNIGTTSGNVTVSTNSNAGYKLYLDTLDSTVHLTNVSSTKSQSYISALATPTSLTNLPANTWGFALTANPVDANTNLSSPQGSNTPLVATTSAATDHYYFTLAANIDTSLPAGQYANTLLLSAIANPETITGLRTITYMQEMTSDICAQSNLHDEKQLIDSRDGQSYWVAKLKDGKCWMTQNLDYQITSAGLNSTTSDINAPNTVWNSTNPGKTPTGSTKLIPHNTTLVSNFPSNIDTTVPTYSYKIPTTWLITTPNNTTICNNPTTFSSCGVTFLNISGASANQFTFEAQPGTYKGVSYPYISIDESNHTYDAHYLVTTYYQWDAATAGGSGTLSGGNSANDSICPKGWRLPTGGPNSTDFAGLYDAGYSNTELPVAQVKQGYLRIDSRKTDGIGTVANYWTSTPHTTNYQAAYLAYGFNATTGGAISKANLAPVRCLAR